jgi:NADPH2:quinone reductase
MAAGSHYASPRAFPVVCGVDGVGRLESGARVFFAGPRPPNGAMAERTVVHKARCWPIPDGIDDVTVAALVNPGMSAWLSLTWRAKLVQGQSVLILGATGTTGKLAIQIAKLLGAGRFIAAGRDTQTLRALPSLGADATIRLGEGGKEWTEALAREAGDKGLDIILDYLWGAPTEALLAAITRPDFTATHSGRMRLIQVGESAGPTISLPASALRSSALEILGAGSGAMPPLDFIRETYNQLLARAGNGELRIDTERIPLANVEAVWQRQEQSRRRIVFVPEGVV